jgi:hypothetical protein
VLGSCKINNCCAVGCGVGVSLPGIGRLARTCEAQEHYLLLLDMGVAEDTSFADKMLAASCCFLILQVPVPVHTHHLGSLGLYL